LGYFFGLNKPLSSEGLGIDLQKCVGLHISSCY